MKNILKGFLLMMSAAVIFAACKKTDSLPYYPTGTAPVLSSDVTTFAPAPADSDNVALTFSWSSPNYATDTSTIKYIIQVDSAGKDFSNAQSATITGTMSNAFTAKQFNNMLIALGF